MDSAWLPTWLSVGWMAAYLVVLLLHLRHAALMRDDQRWWHVGHVLMSLGMIAMYWPAAWSAMPLGERTAVVAFGAFTVAALAVTAALLVRGGDWRIWATTVIDMAAMTYMWVMVSHTVVALTWVFIAWNLLSAWLWASGGALRLLRVHTATASRHPREDRLDLRITLTVMALGMAYMFVVMQYAMGAM